MIVATYNMFGGMKGNSLTSNIMSHYYFYMKETINQVIPFVNNLDNVKSLIIESNADILCINEIIYEIQKNNLVKFLKKIGYQTIIVKKSSQRKNYLNLCTILASKYQGKEIKFNIIHQNSISKEGSICIMEIKKENIIAIGVHLSLLKKFRRKQIAQISSFIENKKDKSIIMMGDFNETLKKLKKYPHFKNMNLFSLKQPKATYPEIDYFRWLKRDYDHIFYSQNHKINNVETKKGFSDHLMLKYELVKIV